MRSGSTLESLSQSPLERALLKQVTTYGMTTRLVWSLDEELKPHLPLEITQSLRRLTKAQVVEAHPLHHGRFYFTLTKRMARELSMANCQGGPFGEPAKIRAFAKLLLGVVYLPGVIPVRAAALADRIGEPIVGLPDVFLLHHASKQLYLVRIDVQPAQAPNHTAQQLRQDVFRLARTPPLKELVRTQQLKLAVAACSDRRCQSILDHFRSYQQVGKLPVLPVAIPELLSLLLPLDLGGVIAKKTF